MESKKTMIISAVIIIVTYAITVTILGHIYLNAKRYIYHTNKKQTDTSSTTKNHIQFDTLNSQARLPMAVSSRNSSAIFHVKVKSIPTFIKCIFAIHFTNDNWATDSTINDCFDVNPGYTPVNVLYFNKVYDTEQQAVNVAKQLLTYEQCEAINIKAQRRVDRLLAHYASNPPKRSIDDELKSLLPKNECTNTEIIIR